MLLDMENSDVFEICASRRAKLISAIKEAYPNQDGLVVFYAGFESERSVFWQESSFYYYTGITEPGTMLTIDMNGRSTLYIPNCADTRAQWIHSPVALTQENRHQLKVDAVEFLGDRCKGFQLFPYSKKENYSSVLSVLRTLVQNKKTIFTLFPANEREYVEQRFIVQRFAEFIPNFVEAIQDISELVARMRRNKDMYEIDLLTKAIEITILAQEAAAHAIDPEILECEVQASLEYIMVGSGARTAFPSIVASGKNATILHYHKNEKELKKGELVVVDIGAAFEGYCADLTRTYPVGGVFNKRQRELYMAVLETQEYIAQLAKPGMYLNNADHPDKSLQHLAKEFLKKHNLDQYFVHGIGHYLGLDVHDVGNAKEPLAVNDVITIEPGVYIPQENIGIRIEDNYWIVKAGAVCLSDNLPKQIADIEQLVQQKFED